MMIYDDHFHHYHFYQCFYMLQAIHRAKGEGNRQHAEDTALKIFIALDKNKDDRLSRDEFFHGVKSSSSVMDMLSSITSQDD